MPFSRISVENYVFGQLENLIYSIYRLKNIDIEKTFQEKKAKIIESYTVKDILEEVCLNKKYWSVNEATYETLLPFK